MNQSDQNEFVNSIQSKFQNSSVEFDTLKIEVDSQSWVDTHKILKVEFNLKFFKHALEWDYFIGVISFYLLTFFMWKKN